jgi:glycosyltransferase involved in cell wall biosynthesis
VKILHVTESLGAGVGHFLALVTRGQIAAGHDVVLAHSIRADTQVAELDAQFKGVRRMIVPMVTEVSLVNDALSVFRLMRLIRAFQPDVIHLHSSKAGVLGRVAVRICGAWAPVFYSPHGFAFLRQDVSNNKQKLFLWFEQLAAKLGGKLVACSRSEADLAWTQVHHPSVYLVENATDLSEIPLTTGSSHQVKVINAGRLCYQKAPWLFRKVAEACSNLPAHFFWLGAGGLAAELQSAATKNLTLTGWLTRADIAKHLADADIFLMPSLWEGMPLALIEAQAAGLPAVVSNVVGCKDVIEDGVSGFVCNSDDELAARTRQLIEDPLLRKRMGENAARIARRRFSVGRMNDEILRLYTAND